MQLWWRGEMCKMWLFTDTCCMAPGPHPASNRRDSTSGCLWPRFPQASLAQWVLSPVVSGCRIRFAARWAFWMKRAIKKSHIIMSHCKGQHWYLFCHKNMIERQEKKIVSGHRGKLFFKNCLLGWGHKITAELKTEFPSTPCNSSSP